MRECDEQQGGQAVLTAEPGVLSPEREGEVARAEADLAWEGTPAASDSGSDGTWGHPDTPDGASGTTTPDNESGTTTSGNESEPVSGQTAETEQTNGTVSQDTQPAWEATYDRDVEELRTAYPTVDAERIMQDPAILALVSGTVRPTLRQAFELCRREELTAQAVQEAVSEAVRKAEENLLTNIRVRGLRPIENGPCAAGAVQTHAAVDRLTKTERADLARRAERGDHVRL